MFFPRITLHQLEGRTPEAKCKGRKKLWMIYLEKEKHECIHWSSQMGTVSDGASRERMDGLRWPAEGCGFHLWVVVTRVSV